MTITLEGDRVAPPPSWGCAVRRAGCAAVAVRPGGTWVGVRVLLISQVALVGLGAASVTRVAVRVLGTATGAALGSGFLLAWGIQAMALFGVHEIAFAVSMLALSLAELVRGVRCGRSGGRRR